MIDEYTTARECYETETEIIVIGGVAHDDESHNCDEMGCGSATPHVKYRIKKSELLLLRARPDDGRVERMAKIIYDHMQISGEPGWDDLKDIYREEYRDCARAIAAADGDKGGA